MHGFVEWPAHQMEISRWNDLADKNGFIIVYPSRTGFPLRWYTYDQPNTKNNPMREVKFISDLIDKLDSEYNIDKTRIYANGLSNGAERLFYWHVNFRTASLQSGEWQVRICCRGVIAQPLDQCL